MVSKIAIMVGVLLVALGVAITVCSMPIFGYTRERTQQSTVQKSQIIMDYSFSLPGETWLGRDVPVQLSPDQTLVVVATGNKVFDFSIVNYTATFYVAPPDPPDETYFSLKNTVSVTTNWSPHVSGSYYIRFKVLTYDYLNPTEITAMVNKTWTEPVENIVTEQGTMSLIDIKFEYVGLGLMLLGIGILVVPLFIIRRRKTKFKG